ncbi:MAG TPA: geranylgeranyl pyrophosphate synthase, partial [Rhodospirillum rubrum]|nr:geranylgeranyl pyrophosphate synthase [Rhodospirillum rubrum]
GAMEQFDGGGGGIELLHCASLVHDDLPCFDDAHSRRGQASVHVAYGEPLAVLAGDALIVMAFQGLASGLAMVPERLPLLLGIVADAVGMPAGICAGQAWESEPTVKLAEYQRAKTGALFAASTMAGAAAAGREARSWRMLGECLGEAYQVADDLRDVAADPAELGKPVGRDAALGRPNAVGHLGIVGAVRRLESLVADAVASVPDCAGAGALRALIHKEAERFLPKELARYAA